MAGSFDPAVFLFDEYEQAKIRFVELQCRIVEDGNTILTCR